jgi:hypothetical protein
MGQVARAVRRATTRGPYRNDAKDLYRKRAKEDARRAGRQEARAVRIRYMRGWDAEPDEE